MNGAEETNPRWPCPRSPSRCSTRRNHVEASPPPTEEESPAADCASAARAHEARSHEVEAAASEAGAGGAGAGGAETGGAGAGCLANVSVTDTLTWKVIRRKGRPPRTLAQEAAWSEHLRLHPLDELGPEDRPLGATRRTRYLLDEQSVRVTDRTVAR